MASSCEKVIVNFNNSWIRHVKDVHVPRGQNPFKLVVTDMDGTLLNSNHSVSDYTRRVLSKLLAIGVHVIFATGRPFTSVKRIKRNLNIFASTESIPTPGVQVVTPAVESPPSTNFPSLKGDEHISHDIQRIVPRCFAITSNGTCIYDETNHLLYEKCIHPKICQELYSMFKDDREVNINIFRSIDEAERKSADYNNRNDMGDDRASEEWVSRYSSDIEAALYHESQFTFRVVPDLEKSFTTEHVNAIFFLCYDLEKSLRVEEAITTRAKELKSLWNLDHSVRVAPSSMHCLDIVPSDVSKASALEFVVKKLGITMKDCIGFGDGLNDVELLESVGKACIMGNASQRLRDRLPQVEIIGTNDDDAVAKKLAQVFSLDGE